MVRARGSFAPHSPQLLLGLAAFVAVVVATLAAAPAPAAGANEFYLDQSTEYTEGAVRLLAGNFLWQSFTAHWTSQLAQIDFYFGTERTDISQCNAATATLKIVQGDSTVPVNASTTLAEKTIALSCEQNCVTKSTNPQCAAWQRFSFATPLPVTEGTLYTIHVTGTVTPMTLHSVVGVSPASTNHGGDSSLPRAPHYETKYAQFTFRTYMTTPSPTVDIGGGGDHTNQDTTPEVPDVSSPAKSRVGAAGVVIPIIVVLLVVLLVAFVVVQRRKWRKEKILDASQLYGISEEDFGEDDDGVVQAQNKSARHPIFVRSANDDNDDDAHNDRPDFQEDSRWADDVSYGTYTKPTQPKKKMLPVAPASVDV